MSKRIDDRAAAIARYLVGEEPNAAPFYSYLMRASSLVAVYKANAVTVNFYRHRRSAEHAWDALSHATNRGIVFG